MPTAGLTPRHRDGRELTPPEVVQSALALDQASAAQSCSAAVARARLLSEFGRQQPEVDPITQIRPQECVAAYTEF